MNDRRQIDLERALGPWLEEAAAAHPIDYLGAVLERTRHTRQRTAWSFPTRWHPPMPVVGPLGVPRTAWLLLLLALLMAFALQTVVGSLHRLPPPYGLARPGLVALDINYHITLMNGDGSGLQVLPDSDGADTAPVWSPDGTRLAFWHLTSDRHWRIDVADGDGKVHASVPVQAPAPGLLQPSDPLWATYISNVGYALGAPSGLSWSPDSRSIAFSQDMRGSPRIWIVGADGSGIRQVGNPDLPARNPVWSPDGTRIAFHGGSQMRGANNGIYVMRADGTGPRRISHVDATGASFSGLHWQPGGHLIAFDADAGAGMHIFVVGSDGADERDVSPPETGGGTTDVCPTWSPDGKQIAFVHVTSRQPGGEIVVENADGSDAKTVLRPSSLEGIAGVPLAKPDQASVGFAGPMWSPDGRTLSVLLWDYATGASLKLVSVDLTGARPPTVVPAGGNFGGTSWQRLAP